MTGSDSTPNFARFTDLSPADIATFYLGTLQRLREAQERQQGPRAKQGSSPGARVHLADLFRMAAEDRLRQLVHNDPAKARDVCEAMRDSLIDPSVLNMADVIERELERDGRQHHPKS